MKIYRDLSEFTPLARAVVTTGAFDGVHKGHQKILNRLREAAREIKGESVVITFHPHPRNVLSPDNKEYLLSTLEEKTKLLSDFRIDHLIIIPFTREFAQTTSADFIKKILIERIGTRKLVIGYDHKFGKNREGSFEYLRDNASEFGFKVDEIPRQDIEDSAISSTHIRLALKRGDVKAAREFLGRYYTLSGNVIRGKQLGKKLGYPTANIEPEDTEKLLPADGIYAVYTIIEGKKYQGMMSIGFNPTLNEKTRSLEVNIFNFNEDIYGKRITIEFVEFLRKEEKFADLELLKEQLARDEENTRKILSKI